MKNIVVIPARMGSSRFPGKPLANILGMPMIGHVYKRALMCDVVDEVFVATCDDEIKEYVESLGGKVIMTKNTHERCTERTAEAIEKIEQIYSTSLEIVVMLQGDEPQITPEMITMAIEGLKNDLNAKVVNLMSELETEIEHNDQNEIKVVVDKNDYALYFSREAIPTKCKVGMIKKPLKQVCVIPFYKDFLLEYVNWEPTYLEIAESIDMNRILENGEKVKMIRYSGMKTYAVDIPEDIIKVEESFKNDPYLNLYLKNEK